MHIGVQELCEQPLSVMLHKEMNGETKYKTIRRERQSKTERGQKYTHQRNLVCPPLWAKAWHLPLHHTPRKHPPKMCGQSRIQTWPHCHGCRLQRSSHSQGLPPTENWRSCSLKHIYHSKQPLQRTANKKEQTTRRKARTEHERPVQVKSPIRVPPGHVKTPLPAAA